MMSDQYFSSGKPTCCVSAKAGSSRPSHLAGTTDRGDHQRYQLTNRYPGDLDDQQQGKGQEGPEQKGMGHLDAGQLAMGPGVVVPHGKQQFLHQLGLGIGLAPQARQVTGVDPA